jgi:uncharacterized protein (DUF983 family)
MQDGTPSGRTGSGRSRRLAAIVRQRCPRCFEGPVFTGWVTMARTCPVCGWRYEREPGYFVAAMYISYMIAVPLLAGIVLAVQSAAPSLSVGWTVVAGLPPFLLLVPLIFRYSRILWMHLDLALLSET